MIIFKAFLQILNKNKGILLLYSAILVFFSAFSLKSSESTVIFESAKPDIYISNQDLDPEGNSSVLAASLVKYLAERSNIIELDSGSDGQLGANEALDDAIFYRQINFALEIPQDFEKDFLAGKNPEVAYKGSGDYYASLAEMNIARYLDLANTYLLLNDSVDDLVGKLESTLANETSVELVSHLDANALARAGYYYDFMNYPLLVGCIFMICLVFLSFRDPKIANRLTISALPQAKINRILFQANLAFAFVLWLAYVVLSFVLTGNLMWSAQGAMLILSSLIFTVCVVALAFLLANIVKGRNALNGIVNVIGLGSSFLCGVFVPMSLLPDAVRAIAHVLPSYWYIEANNLIINLEEFSWEKLAPVLSCFLVVLGFALVFVIATNIISTHRRK